jgi:hypothetical protein
MQLKGTKILQSVGAADTKFNKNLSTGSKAVREQAGQDDTTSLSFLIR